MHSPQQLILRPDVDGKHLGKHLLVLLSLAITCTTNKKYWTWCNYLQIAAVVVSKVIYRNRLYLCQIQEKGKASFVWTKSSFASNFKSGLQRKLVCSENWMIGNLEVCSLSSKIGIFFEFHIVDMIFIFSAVKTTILQSCHLCCLFSLLSLFCSCCHPTRQCFLFRL